jgi:CRP-like cAMP-binding protein
LPTLTHHQLLAATHNLTPRQYEPGAMIVSVGTNADTFYIVSKGTVEVVLPRPNHSDVIAAQLGPGKFFGEMAFFHDRKRQASVRAYESGPVEVLELTYNELDELLSQSETTRDLLRNIADRNEQRSASLRADPQEPPEETAQKVLER